MPNIKLAIVPVTPFNQNCTILWDDDTKRAIVVDPGGDAEQIMAGLRGTNLHVEAILLTHGHLDHAGAANELKSTIEEEQGAPVPLLGPHEADAFLMAEIETQAAKYGLSGMANCTTDRFLTEGETLEIGPFTFQTLHCPGHSPGSLVYFEPTLRFALVGDVLFKGSIGRTDFPYGDHDSLITAIKTKLLPLGDDIGFICGHGPGSKFGTERTTNPFLHE